jgi:hypothetical protein
MTVEHTPKPGARWEAVVRRTETVVPDEPADAEPEPVPQPNRRTRRSLARQARREGQPDA